MKALITITLFLITIPLYGVTPEEQRRIEAAIRLRNMPAYINAQNQRINRMHSLRLRTFYIPSCQRRRPPDSYVPPAPYALKPYTESNTVYTYNPNITTGDPDKLPMTSMKKDAP